MEVETMLDSVTGQDSTLVMVEVTATDTVSVAHCVIQTVLALTPGHDELASAPQPLVLRVIGKHFSWPKLGET
jgi:hypothetical protein